MLSVTLFVPRLAYSVLDDWVIQKYKFEKDSTTGERTRVLGERNYPVWLECLRLSGKVCRTRLSYVSMYLYSCMPNTSAVNRMVESTMHLGGVSKVCPRCGKSILFCRTPQKVIILLVYSIQY